MKRIQILGTGCPKCSKLAINAEDAATELGLECDIEKVTDIEAIMSFNVMTTPALVIDGDIKVVGRVPTKDEIKEMLA
jgi:small redox-active disulfide protein 2